MTWSPADLVTIGFFPKRPARYGLRSLPVAFDGERELPLDLSRIRPEPSPPGYAWLGYDLCSRSAGTNLECSPLSCNDLAGECGANRSCLLDDFDDALRTVRTLCGMGAEPGPYLLIEVWADRPPDQVQTEPGAATDAVRG